MKKKRRWKLWFCCDKKTTVEANLNKLDVRQQNKKKMHAKFLKNNWKNWDEKKLKWREMGKVVSNSYENLKNIVG